MSPVQAMPEFDALKALILALITPPQQQPMWAVEEFPDKPDQYRLSHPNGAILIQYGHSTYGQSEAMDVSVQQRTEFFLLTLVGRQQHGEVLGVVNMVQRLVCGLAGKCCGDCEAIVIRKDYFVSENAGVWQHAIDLSMVTTLVGAPVEFDVE